MKSVKGLEENPIDKEYEQFLLFPPVEGDLRNEYPELASVPEFAKLKAKELTFVWAFVILYRGDYMNYHNHDNIKSPRRSRITLSLKFATSREWMDRERWDEWASGNIPAHIEEAIERMEVYQPGYRLRAFGVLNKAFENYLNMVEASPISDREDGEEGGASNAKEAMKEDQYARLVGVAPSKLEELIKKLEEGFGMRKVKVMQKRSGEKEISIMDRFHDQRQNR